MNQSKRFAVGIPLHDALDIFRTNVNLPDTIFSTEHWLTPKLDELRDLLSDPLTPDHATALDDVLTGRHFMRDLIEWLESAHGLTWSEFFPFREKKRREDLWAEWLRSGGSRPGQKHRVHGKLVVCPRCRSHWVVPVLYGLPSEVAEEAALRGALAMGGCCPPSPWSERNQWCCKKCRFRWPGRFEENSLDCDLPAGSSNR
jgi:hypothetical protein